MVYFRCIRIDNHLMEMNVDPFFGIEPFESNGMLSFRKPVFPEVFMAARMMRHRQISCFNRFAINIHGYLCHIIFVFCYDATVENNADSFKLILANLVYPAVEFLFGYRVVTFKRFFVAHGCGLLAGNCYLVVGNLSVVALNHLQSGEKIYLYLFDLIEGENSLETIMAEFDRKYGAASLDMAAKYLKQNILECLIHLRGKQDIQARIFELLSVAGILFERGLKEEAMAELGKAKQLAVTYEMDSLELLIRRTELKYLSAHNFRHISEKQLVGKQTKVMEVMKYSRSAYLHTQLYDILKYRLMYKGYTHSRKQKDEYNDLVLSELHVIANNSYKGFETRKLHILFQATYYMNTGNYTVATRNYKQLIALFEENTHMILNPPIYYLEAILGALNSLWAVALYDDMPYFINKLKEIEAGDYTSEFRLMVRAYIFLYEFDCTFHTGNSEKAAEIIEAAREGLIEKINFLSIELQLYLYLDLIVLALSTANLVEARKWMKKIAGDGKVFYTQPAYRYVRLINLLLQTECGNYDFLENEIKSIKRQIHYDKEQDITEKLVFKFVLNHHQLNQPTKREMLKKELRKKYPRTPFFNFPAWIETKLE